ncbi:hypothetical protein DYB38_000941 [Aphanomyces astaci]|uniref:Uncharacterized protein n=1 Tax=Aphanomyces astaci TaxID=112090 RepID=A0A397E127_APHAT|nr:hypothetical protein DYB38_000941 [Aphanomyces astaci]
MTWFECMEAVCGFLYVAASIASGVVYLQVLYPSFANELTWPYFNTSTHLFIGDLCNFHLALDSRSEVLLLASSSAVLRSPSVESMGIAMNPVYPRMLVLQASTDFEDVIQGLHANELNLGLPTQYCWVDFDKTFEMAHTAARQARCASMYHANAAVHYEAVLRNIPWAKWETSFGGPNGSFTRAIAAGVMEFPTGSAWLKAVQNAFIIEVVDAYGFFNKLIVKSLSYLPQATGSKSTVLNSVITSDMPFARLRNYSLVRGTSRQIPDELILFNSGMVPTLVSQLWETNIGPYGAIDAVWVPVPPSLADIVHSFQGDVLSQLTRNATVLAAVQELGYEWALPTPRAWSGGAYEFSGGNPMCDNTHRTSFVQETFGFDDMCLTSLQLSVEMDAVSVLFALVVSSQAQLNSVKSYRDSTTRSFMSTPLLMELLVDIRDVSVFQFAYHDTSELPLFLTQSLLDPNDHAWSLYGWVMLYDWAMQRREVVRFDGDVDSITLVSKRYDPQPFVPSSLDASQRPDNFSKFFATYVTVVLSCVGAVMVVYGCITQFRVMGRNLFRFNRVVGSVWAGKIFQYERGITAVALLSSSTIELRKTMGLSYFVLTRRSTLELLLVASEATWVAYTVQDVLAAIFTEHSYYAAPVSTAFAWATMIVFETLVPSAPYLHLERTCKTLVVGTQVECRSGQLHFGHPVRLNVLVGFQVGWIVLVYALAILFHQKRESSRVTLWMSVASHAFLDRTLASDHHSFCFDRVTCIMSGLITVHTAYYQYVFDVKSWSIYRERFQPPEFNGPHAAQIPARERATRSFHSFDRFMAVAGLAYMVISWSHFNASGGYGYLASWYSTQLMLNPIEFNTSLDNPMYADSTPYNTTSTVISSSALYANIVQFEAVNSLAIAIQGLKNMDICDVAQIMTPYCWLEFHQQFAMANSVKRQTRCELEYTSNGAVYLESALRNVGWQGEALCWDFPPILGDDFMASAHGAEWVQRIQTTSTTVEDEVRYWHAFGLTHYTTQFQNYKTMGLVESFRIRNALGFEYSLPLKYGNASMQFGAQTSMKLYWSFAMDLSVVFNMYGFTTPTLSPSLLASSPHYVYANVSLHEMFVQLGVLHAPLGAVYTTLTKFYSIASNTISALMTTNADAQLAYNDLALPTQWVPCPLAWIGVKRYSGSILCQDLSATSSTTMLLLWTHNGCTSASENLHPTRMSSLIAARVSQRSSSSVSTCKSETRSVGRCHLFLDEAANLSQSFFSRQNLSTHAAYARAAQLDIYTLNVSLLQFRHDDGTALVHNLFSPDAAAFWFFSWGFVFEWLLGNRDVVSFEGDEGRLMLMSSTAFSVESLPNPIVIPYLMSRYTRNVVVYITAMIAAVAVVTAMYIVGSVGRVEGWNVLEINRVAAVVWAGRPLLFLRSLVAFCLLSTSQLHLTQFGPVGLMTAFEFHQLEWYRVVLTAGEATWFVYVLCDVLIVVTKQHTAAYTTYSGLIVWVIAIALSVYSPVTGTAVVNRACSSPVVDFKLQCDAGVVSIGSVTRVWELVGISLVSVGACYLFQLIRHPSLPDTRHSVSLLLSCGATYLFTMDNWKYKHGYYLDKASAVITGLVCVQVKRKFYILDIKLWRMFVIDIPPDLQVPKTHPMYDRVRYAFPLLSSATSVNA